MMNRISACQEHVRITFATSKEWKYILIFECDAFFGNIAYYYDIISSWELSTFELQNVHYYNAKKDIDITVMNIMQYKCD